MKTIRFLLVYTVFMFIATFQLSGQDLFELKFTDKNNTQYKGLLIVFNESKMYMRVAYYAEDMYKVVQVDYTSTHEVVQGEEYLILLGSNPRFITAAGQYGYNPDHLIFTDQYDVPIITDNPQDPSQTMLADEFRTLTAYDIDDNYLREFYGNQEQDYFALRKMFRLDGNVVDNRKPDTRRDYQRESRNSYRDQPATLHLIVAANTAISDIGSGCEVDQRNLLGEFEGITSTLGISYKKYLVSGNNFTKANMVNTLNNFSPGPNDIVIFVYRGHGFRYSDQRETWPQLDFRTNNYMRISNETAMNLNEIYGLIKQKGARLNIVFGDCCNNDIGLTQNTNNNFLVMQANNNYDPQRLSDLFMEQDASILSCAASPGEYSWVNVANGGFYTVSFLQAMREEISYLKNDTPDWQDIFNETVRHARKKTDACSNCTPQNGKTIFEN